MTDSLPSDHPAVDSHRVRLGRIGSTTRPQLPLPADISPGVGDIICLILDGQRTYAEVISTLDDRRAVRGAYATRQLARTGDGTDLFSEWCDAHTDGAGTTLVLDVLTEGYAYGLREPGARVVYTPPKKPNDSLADIAKSLDQ